MYVAATDGVLKAWVADHAWIKLPAYALAIAIVVVPVLWRVLNRSTKIQWTLLAFVVLWLRIFNVIEDKIVMHPMFEPGWHVGEEVVDLLMWVGWIPVAIWLNKILENRLAKS